MSIKRNVVVILTALFLMLSSSAVSEPYIFPMEPALPTIEDISMSDAITAAKSEMVQRESLSFDDIQNHTIKANFVKLETSEFAWIVILESNEITNRISATATVSPVDGTMMDYQASDPNTEITMILIDRWTKRKGAMKTWSIEDKALFNLLYGWQDGYVVPTENHMNQEAVKAIALSALPENLSSPEFSFSFELVSYTDGTPEQYIWRVTIFVQNKERYQVQVSAIDGTVVDIWKMDGLG